MQSGNQDNGSSNLSRTLQESLSEVLREVEGSRMSTGGFNANNLTGLSALNMPSGGFGAGFGSSSSSFLPASASAAASFGGGFAGNRNFAGMSTEELLKAAALEQAEKSYQSRRLYNESTASLLALMKGNPANAALAAGGGGIGGGGTNSLLQQSYQQMFKQPPLMAAAAAAVPPIASMQPALPPAETKNALKVLGSSLRKKSSPYLDVSVLQDTDTSDKRTRGGVTEPFPEKLHRMIKEVEDEGKSDVIGFFAHGRAFAVHDPDRFIAEVMPKYFKQSRLSSFQRQLNLYGFTRISSGPDAGGYYHELFLRNRPNLAVHMRRVGLPQGNDRRKMRAKNMKNEPNFYAMGNVDTAIVKLPGML